MFRIIDRNRISNEEYNQIIKEIAERIKDLFYADVEIKLKQKFSKRFFEKILFTDTIEITYSVTLVSNDVRQILNRIRKINHEKNL